MKSKKCEVCGTLFIAKSLKRKTCSASCRREYRKWRYSREYINQMQRQWRAANRERVNATERAWRAANKERLNAYDRAWQREQRDLARAMRELMKGDLT